MALHDEILNRFPQLASWRYQSGGSAVSEIPTWVGLLLSECSGESDDPICFVLPRAGNIPRIVALLHGLLQFKRRFPKIIANKEFENLRSGDRIKVNPSGHVFIYKGKDPSDPHNVRLQYLSGSCCRTVPWSEMMRLEKTERSMPKGNAGSNLNAVSDAPLDQLLGTKTWGNQSLCQTEVVVLDTQSGFCEFAAQTRIFPAGANPDEFLPIGRMINIQGLPSHEAESGEWFEGSNKPLIAVTKSPSVLESYCENVERNSKVIIANGIGLLKEREQEFRTIASNQRLVIIASDDDDEGLSALAAQGCRVWRISKAEFQVFPGESCAEFRRVQRWAEHKANFSLESIPCMDGALGAVCKVLQELGEGSEDAAYEQTKGSAWSLLTTAASLIEAPDEPFRAEIRERLEAFRIMIDTQRVWLGGSVERFHSIHRMLAEWFAGCAQTSAAKGNELYKILLDGGCNGETSCLLARNTNHAARLQAWLNRKRPSLPRRSIERLSILTPRTLPDDADFTEVVCVSWYCAEFFRRVAATLVTPRVKVLTYEFEKPWLEQFHRRLSQSPKTRSLSPAEKLVRFGPTNLIPEWPTDPVVSLAPAIQSGTFDIIKFEDAWIRRRKDGSQHDEGTDRLECRYINFVGESYAYLTNTRKMPVVTGLISKTGNSAEIEERFPELLQSGDFVVFARSGDHDLLTEIADRRLGRNAAEIRSVAGLWRVALQNPGRTLDSALSLITRQPSTHNPTDEQAWALDPGRFKTLAELIGHRISIAAAKDWFKSDDRIGPGRTPEETRRTLKIIGLVTDHAELNRRMDEVVDAVRQVRSAHVSAGSALRDALLRELPKQLSRIEEAGTLINLGDLGSAWVVQVESVSPETEQRSRSAVNRLHRSSSIEN